MNEIQDQTTDMIEDKIPEAAEVGKPTQSTEVKLPTAVANDDGTWNIKVVKEGDLASLFGDTNDRLGTVLTGQCFGANGMVERTFDKEGDTIAVVAGLAPRDALEAILATQMAATHMAIMRHSAKLGDATQYQAIEMHERILTKLSRTFTTQMEALRKHRNGGKQTVTVQHVNVEDGGRAIVGNVSRGEGRA